MLLVNAVNTEGRPLEIFVKDGRIAAVGQELEALAGDNETVVDAGGLTVLPAFVDLHCHWRTPGFEYKEDVETGSRAAAAGGYTFVNLMPNTKPVCSSAAQAMQVEQKAAEVGLCDVNQTVSGLMVAYGYDVVSTLITSIDLPADVEQSMNRINSAQREKEAAQSLAEAERIKVVTEARARAEAMEQAGRGIAAQRKAIADGISESLAVIKSSGVSAAEANQLFIFTQWTDMMSEFARNGRQTTVVLPSDFSQTASMFEQMLVAQKTEDEAEFVIVEEEEK